MGARLCNSHGLGRDIPDGVARKVRQQCGFGCVFCGKPYTVYHHFDPPFKDAHEHRAEGIALLCGGCHGRRESGLLSEETLSDFYQRPFCLQEGFTRGALDLAGSPLSVTLGTVTVVGVSDIIRVDGETILAILPPEQPGAPFRLNANLRDADGDALLAIEDNNWIADTGLWDVLVEGPRITIRQALRKIALVMRAEPPRGVVIERLEMRHKDATISAAEGKRLSVTLDSGETIESGDGTFINCKCAFDIGDERIRVGVKHEEITIAEFRLDNRGS